MSSSVGRNIVNIRSFALSLYCMPGSGHSSTQRSITSLMSVEPSTTVHGHQLVTGLRKTNPTRRRTTTLAITCSASELKATECSRKSLVSCQVHSTGVPPNRASGDWRSCQLPCTSCQHSLNPPLLAGRSLLDGRLQAPDQGIRALAEGHWRITPGSHN